MDTVNTFFFFFLMYKCVCNIGVLKGHNCKVLFFLTCGSLT